MTDSVWCVVANVTNDLAGDGTKHFVRGTKLYVFPPKWDGDNLQVLGRHRGSSRLISLVMPSKRMHNWRAKEVFHPHVVNEMRQRWVSQENAESFAAMMQRRIADGIQKLLRG